VRALALISLALGLSACANGENADRELLVNACLAGPSAEVLFDKKLCECIADFHKQELSKHTYNKIVTEIREGRATYLAESLSGLSEPELKVYATTAAKWIGQCPQ